MSMDKGKRIFILAVFAVFVVSLIWKFSGNGEGLPQTNLIQTQASLKAPEGVTAHTPPLEVNIEQYRTRHPSSALIYTEERLMGREGKGLLLYEGPVKEISALHKELDQIGDKIYYCYLPDDWMEQIGISIEPKEDTEHTYEFERITDCEALTGFCNPFMLCGFDGEEQARVYGSLRTLFGEPDYETKDVEDMYQYMLRVIRSDGKQAVLMVYSGSSGPSVSSREEDKDIKEGAAFVLKKLLQETPPSDYIYEGCYWDGPCIVTYGSKAGRPYYKSRVMTEKEIKDERKSIGNLGDV